MKILLIQGAGEGAHTEDQALADYLTTALGANYALAYPRFSGLENVDYDAWKAQAKVELETLGGNGIIVAHSLGGSALLKYLSEEAQGLPIRALFLIAAPYKANDGEWGTDDFAMSASFASTLPELQPLFMYHSQDDEWVPFAHLAQWAEKLPFAIVRRFDDRGHSFSALPFVELVEDIRSVQNH